MNQTHRQLLVACGAAFCVFLLARVPAQLLGPVLKSAGIQATGLSGTLWQGEARQLTVGTLRLEQPKWRTAGLALLMGRLQAQVDSQMPDGFVRATIARSLTGTITVSNVEAAAPLAALVPRMPGITGAGQLSVKLDSLTLADGWVRAVTGTARVANVRLALPGLQGPDAGAAVYELALDADEVTPEKPLTGLLADAGGPLEIRGRVVLTPPANYEVTGTVKARPGAPPAVAQQLQMVGPRTPDGGHEFTLAGSF